MAEDKELIDLNKLSQRELLILLHSDVKELKAEMKEAKEGREQLALKVNSLETRNKVWSAVVGFFSGLIAVFIGR